MPKQTPGMELDITRKERDQKVVRSVHLIQHAQYSLSLQEQRFLLYCISKVQPDDQPDNIYTIHLKDYLAVCGLRGTTSYDALKKQIIDTMKRMVLGIESVDEEGHETFTVVNWFAEMSVTRGAGKVKYQFSPRIAKELIGLAQYNATAENANKLYYISDELKYMLPFKCRYSYYLYPLLRSYQNRNEWTFPLDELRVQLDVFERLEDAKDYKDAYGDHPKVERKPLYPRFVDFKRFVLDEAIADINEYSNIKVAYRPEKKGRTVVAVTFIFEDKEPKEKLHSEQRGQLILDRNDEFTNRVNAHVPAVEDPLEFTTTNNTGDDTIPKSVTVKKRLRRKGGADLEEIRRSMAADMAEMAKPKKPVDYGKHGKRQRIPPIPVVTDESLIYDGIYNTLEPHGEDWYAADGIPGWMQADVLILPDPASKKRFVLHIDVDTPPVNAIIGSDLKMFDEVTPEKVLDFMDYVLMKYGAKRLRMYKEDGVIHYKAVERHLFIYFDLKTAAGDYTKFLRRCFRAPENRDLCIVNYMRERLGVEPDLSVLEHHEWDE